MSDYCIRKDIEAIQYNNDELNIKIESTRRAMRCLQGYTGDIRKKLKYMKDKMMYNDHSTMQVNYRIKHKTDELNGENGKIAEQEAKVDEMNDAISVMREERSLLRQQISKEEEILKNIESTAVRNFFASEVQDDTPPQMDGNTKEWILLKLEKKLEVKQQTSEIIAPIVKLMNRKIYFRARKRRQRKELNTVQEEVLNDISDISEAIELLSQF